jgi:hypothetical protein
VSEDREIIAEIDRLYQWIDQTLANHRAQAGECNACGKCCDFDAYGHRLYVTHAEMLYFSEKIGTDNLKPMPSGACPYRVNHRCSVHEYRFSGCRIYGCQGDAEFQNQLTEQALDKIKAWCDTLGVPYEYSDLRQALNRSQNL